MPRRPGGHQSVHRQVKGNGKGRWEELPTRSHADHSGIIALFTLRTQVHQPSLIITLHKQIIVDMKRRLVRNVLEQLSYWQGYHVQKTGFNWMAARA